ncbi:unnamed protein product [Leptosia nina]|uniref:Leucine-rich repeat-containing protein 71 n=1 Tax=Leptosia nina TaxID=320188 RepID=A0AAV1J7V4_9NEOP
MKEPQNRNSITHSKTVSSSKSVILTPPPPKPLDFEGFIPWKIMCHKKILGSKSKYFSKQTAKTRAETDIKLSDSAKIFPSDSTLKSYIPISAYYDPRGRLVEIVIDRSPFEIPRKVIVAFSLCVPFHSSLTRVSIRNGGLKLPALYEIGKLLSHSTITDVVIENCFVPEGTYQLLLEHVSHLRNLALRRLCINDMACCNIAKGLEMGEPASKTLLTLDLTSNKITDDGAKAFGDMLRKKRCLLHLNLCDNNLSDAGAAYILNCLKSFPLTCQEIQDTKRRRFEHFIKRIAVYKKHVEHLTRCQGEEKISNEFVDKKGQKKVKGGQTVSAVTSALSIPQLADKLTQDEIGEFVDVFGCHHVTYVNKVMNCDGNLRLCSLNLAYNNLSFLSVRKIYEVLLYQRNVFTIYKPSITTGLLRVVFDGNNVPSQCKEVRLIQDLLHKLVTNRCPSKNVPLKAQSSNSVMSSTKTGKTSKPKKSIAR